MDVLELMGYTGGALPYTTTNPHGKTKSIDFDLFPKVDFVPRLGLKLTQPDEFAWLAR
jgi:hypothetical protein